MRRVPPCHSLGSVEVVIQDLSLVGSDGVVKKCSHEARRLGRPRRPPASRAAKPGMKTVADEPRTGLMPSNGASLLLKRR